MTTPPIISCELPRPQVCMAWDYDEWKQFHQQAQREAIERFCERVLTEAQQNYPGTLSPAYAVEVLWILKDLRQQLQNEKEQA